MVEVWDTLGGYLSLLWLSFVAAVGMPRTLGTLLAPHIITMVFWAWVLSFVLFIMWWRRVRWRKARLYLKRLRGSRMTPEQRVKYLREVLSDDITDKLESRYYYGDITAQEKDMLFREVALKLGLPDLLRYSQADLKERIRRRRAEGFKDKVSDYENKDFAANRTKVFGQQADAGQKQVKSLIEEMCTPSS